MRYGEDPFYRWVGINSPLMYAAHKAAGGITSIYRQLGKGGERLFQRVLQDEFDLSIDQSFWTYVIPAAGGKARTLELDGRIDLSHLADGSKKDRVDTWLDEVAAKLRLEKDYRAAAKGIVFEVRQGYKSADSKRQNADVANAASCVQARLVLAQRRGPNNGSARSCCSIGVLFRSESSPRPLLASRDYYTVLHLIDDAVTLRLVLPFGVVIFARRLIGHVCGESHLGSVRCQVAVW